MFELITMGLGWSGIGLVFVLMSVAIGEPDSEWVIGVIFFLGGPIVWLLVLFSFLKNRKESEEVS